MGKKKQVEGNVISLELPVEQPVVKKKKELTDKQREGLAKGMAILKAKREAKSKNEDAKPEVEEAEKKNVVAPPAPAIETPSNPSVEPVAPVAHVEKKPRKPRVTKNYLTTEDLQSFKQDLLSSLKPPTIEKPVEYKPVQNTSSSSIVKERVISGSELLNKIFNL